MAEQAHKHQAPALHSPGQQRMFFALINVLKLDAQEAKERAKSRFKVDCFNKIKVGQLNELLDLLVHRQMEKAK